MIKDLDLFKVIVRQPENLIPGNTVENTKNLASILCDPLECDLIILPFGCISGCSKNQSLTKIKVLKDEVDKNITHLNKSVHTPVIIDDITGLYYLNNLEKAPKKIEGKKIRLADKATIRFIDDDQIINSTPIQELSEDLVVFYDTNNRSFPAALTKANGNSAFWISSKYEDSVNIVKSPVIFFNSGYSNKNLLPHYDIEPKTHKPEELGEYFEIKESIWDVDVKRGLYYFHPDFSYLVKYNSFYCDMVFDKQVRGIMNKLKKLGKGTKSIIGVSGGSDSTLALLATQSAYVGLDWDVKDIIGVSMPCFGTTDRTKNNAKKLIDGLGVTYREIEIKDPVISHLTSINHSPDSFNTTYENAQARMRMMTLFGLSNDLGGIVMGTGDLSETWLGWCTYGGDDLAGYNPNSRLLKTTVLQVIKFLSQSKDTTDQVKEVLLDILDTPISPELIQGGNQKSEDILGPYILHDIIITGICLGWNEARIKKMAEIYTEIELDEIENVYERNLKRFSSSQFKRSINVPGPKVGLDNDILNNINMPTDFEL